MNGELPTGTVTLLFTDIEGSTRLLDSLGPLYGELLAAHHALLRAVWVRHGGVEFGTEGDAFFVAFSDPPAAVAAACEAQLRLAGHEWPGGAEVRVRMGLHTGIPQVSDGTYWGSDVHYAARLASAANGGQILASETTRPFVSDALFQSLGEHALKDFPTLREVFHVVVDGRSAEEFAPPRTLNRARTNLPDALAPLLGREYEVSELTARCSNGQSLVTLVGPGGSGKTRLALEIGRRLTDEFDGVWLVELEEVADPDELVPAVARVLGLREVVGTSQLDRVLEHLRTRSQLLVLDNVEHLLDAAPAIARLAAAGERVRILATSQAPLRVSGESVWRLEPLAVPADDETDPRAVEQVPAVRLLLERARSAGAGLEVDEDNSQAIVRLCRQLEGMPLAIELAAARLNLLDPAQLSQRVEREMDALGKGRRDLPARQRGVRAMLEWTTRLLEEDDRQLLARLSAFPGGFSVDLAEAAFGDVIEGLSALLDVSLLTRESSGRLNVRPPVRRFAAQLLAEMGEEAQAHGAAADAVAEVAERFERRWFVRGGEGRLALSPEAANIVALLDWAREHDPQRHARLAASTGWWMTHSARAGYSRSHLLVALDGAVDPVMRARCLQALGTLGLADADPSDSLRAADAWRELGEVDGEVFSLLYAANLHSHRGEGDAGMALASRAEAVVNSVPEDEELRWALDAVRAAAMWDVGHHEEADGLIRSLLATAQPGSWREFWAATKLADFALLAHRHEEALAMYGVAMKALEPLSSRRCAMCSRPRRSWRTRMCARSPTRWLSSSTRRRTEHGRHVEAADGGCAT